MNDGSRLVSSTLTKLAIDAMEAYKAFRRRRRGSAGGKQEADANGTREGMDSRCYLISQRRMDRSRPQEGWNGHSQGKMAPAVSETEAQGSNRRGTVEETSDYAESAERKKGDPGWANAHDRKKQVLGKKTTAERRSLGNIPATRATVAMQGAPPKRTASLLRADALF